MLNWGQEYQEKCHLNREMDSNRYSKLIVYTDDRSWVSFLVILSWAGYYASVFPSMKWGNTYYVKLQV